jgi:hypothetical protein
MSMHPMKVQEGSQLRKNAIIFELKDGKSFSDPLTVR